MRVCLIFVFTVLLSFPSIAAEIPGQSRIDAVTVFPTGAEVRRVATVHMDAGEQTLIFQDLPAQALASSIRVEGKATGRLEIGSVETRRTTVWRGDAQAMAAARRALEDELRSLRDRRAELQADVEAAEQQKTFLRNLAKLPTRGDAASATSGAKEDWPGLLALIGQQMSQAGRALLEAQVKTRQVDEDIRDREGKLRSQAPVVAEVTEARVAVAAATALDADLVILYQVANASWTPLYDARLSTGSRTIAPKLVLSRRAQITQRTGEPWTNVQMALSTTRPGSGTAAPTLRPVVVDYVPDRPPPPPAPVAGVSAPAPAMAPRGLTKQVRSTVDGAADEPAAEEAKVDQVVATETQASVDAAAFQAIFTIPGRVDVPNTGAAKRVAIEENEIEPQLVVRTVPRVEARAYLYAKLTMPKSTPYLPGQVALFRDQTFVGNGQLPQLAPGEDYELGFGGDDLVKVKAATIDEKRGEGGLISSTRTDERSYRMTIKNLHERPVQLTVMDQLPVSNQQDIKVELVSKTVPTRRDVEDKRGVLAWDDKLGPDEERTIDFGYRVSWPGAKQVMTN